MKYGYARVSTEDQTPVTLTPAQIGHARKLIDNREARQDVADLLNVGCSTLYRTLS